MTDIDQKLTLSVDETATLLGISPGLVYELVRTDRLPAIRLGRRIVIPPPPRRIPRRSTAPLDRSGS